MHCTKEGTLFTFVWQSRTGQRWLPQHDWVAERWLLHIWPHRSCSSGLMHRSLQGLWRCCCCYQALMPPDSLGQRRADGCPRLCSLHM